MTEESSKHLTRWVAQTLRSQIVSGELSPGDKLPSQKVLEGQFKVSTVTVRNAVEELEDEGLIAKRQGAHTQVHDREPVHRLVVPGPGPESAERANERVAERVAERPVSFIGFDRGRMRRESATHRLPATRYVASLLEVPAGEEVVQRSVTVFDGDEPVLVSTSYLQPVLAVGSTVPEVEIGQLALVGRPVTSVDLGLRTRMPDPQEFEALGMVKGTPVLVLTHRVLVGGPVEDGNGQRPDGRVNAFAGNGREDPTAVRAAVEVVARGDRVFVQWQPVTQ